MNREEAIKGLTSLVEVRRKYVGMQTMKDEIECLDMAIRTLKQEPRKGEWLRMSNLPEQLDDRYECSCCGNVVHHKNKMNLYTFNSWCGRCGSDNGRNIEVEL